MTENIDIQKKSLISAALPIQFEKLLEDVKESLEAKIKVLEDKLEQSEKNQNIDSTTFSDQMQKIIQITPKLTERNKALFMIRYVKLVNEYYKKNKINAWVYNIFRCLIHTGNVFVPAGMAIMYIFENGICTPPPVLFWVIFLVSVLVACLATYIDIFRLQKNYYIYRNSLEQFKSEGWLFLELSGKYGKDDGINGENDHNKQANKFFNSIEHINSITVKQEFKVRNEKSHKSQEPDRFINFQGNDIKALSGIRKDTDSDFGLDKKMLVI